MWVQNKKKRTFRNTKPFLPVLANWDASRPTMTNSSVSQLEHCWLCFGSKISIKIRFLTFDDNILRNMTHLYVKCKFVKFSHSPQVPNTSSSYNVLDINNVCHTQLINSLILCRLAISLTVQWKKGRTKLKCFMAYGPQISIGIKSKKGLSNILLHFKSQRYKIKCIATAHLL